jgi:hypothetical protein
MQKLGAPMPNFDSGAAHFLARIWARPNPHLKMPNQPEMNNQ